MFEPDDQSKIRIGISACLLGEPVRYDGGHKKDGFITGTLSDYFEWVPVCPEVEIGLGTPRPTIRLERHGNDIRLVCPKTEEDLTTGMRRYAVARVRKLIKEDLRGYILKAKSPSCGMERVKVYSPSGRSSRQGKGVFAEALLEKMPNLPVEEEGRLCDSRLRENWIERVFAYDRLKQLWSGGWKSSDLVRFHTVHKFLVLAHSQVEYRQLGRLVAQVKTIRRTELRQEYESLFMSALSKFATTRKHTNVLEHMLGFLKKNLDSRSRQEICESITDYREGLVPLVVPMTLIRHHVRILDVDYLRDQVYLNPHPRELALRNHV